MTFGISFVASGSQQAARRVMDLAKASARLARVHPTHLDRQVFVRAYNTVVRTEFDRRYFFDSEWSYARGYRYNFKGTHPVLYLTADQLAATFEIGPRTREALLGSHLVNPSNPHLHVSVRLTADLLNLTDPRVRTALGVTMKELLVVRSAHDDGKSAVHFVETPVG